MKTIRALARGLEVISALNEGPASSFCRLSHKTGLPKATLLRILKTLEAAGWVYHCRANGEYRLHSSVCTLGDQIFTRDGLVEIAAPILDEFYSTCGRPSDIAICTGYGMRILESTRRFSPIASHGDVLGSHPHMLQSALGRAYLSYCSEPERERILENLRCSSDHFDRMVERDQWIKRLLAKTCASGFGLSESGYWEHFADVEPGIGTIAVPIILHGHIHCCINLWIECTRSEQRVTDEWFPLLRSMADRIECELLQKTNRQKDDGLDRPYPLGSPEQLPSWELSKYA